MCAPTKSRCGCATTPHVYCVDAFFLYLLTLIFELRFLPSSNVCRASRGQGILV